MMTDTAAFFDALQKIDPSLRAMTDRGDGNYVAIKPLLFHWTMIIGPIGDLDGYSDRYCYEDELLAVTALDEWQKRGWQGEPIGWHRHPNSGRRRPGGVASKEYVAP